MRLAYQALVRTPEYALDTDRQASLVRPLYFGLLDEEQEQYAKKRLLEALDHYGRRLGTGISVHAADSGCAGGDRYRGGLPSAGTWRDARMALYAEGGSQHDLGVWEGTSAQGGIASLDHYSKGAVCEWLFREMCGIHVTGESLCDRAEARRTFYPRVHRVSQHLRLREERMEEDGKEL